MKSILNTILVVIAITITGSALSKGKSHSHTPVAGKGTSQFQPLSSHVSEVSVNENTPEKVELAEAEKAKELPKKETDSLDGYSAAMFTRMGCAPCIPVETYEVPMLRNNGIECPVYDVIEPSNLRYSQKFNVTQYPTICVFKNKELTHKFTNTRTTTIRAARIIDTLAGVKIRAKTTTKTIVQPQPAMRSKAEKKKTSSRQRSCKCSPCTCQGNVKLQKVSQSSRMGKSFSRSRTVTKTSR